MFDLTASIFSESLKIPFFCGIWKISCFQLFDGEKIKVNESIIYFSHPLPKFDVYWLLTAVSKSCNLDMKNQIFVRYLNSSNIFSFVYIENSYVFEINLYLRFTLNVRWENKIHINIVGSLWTHIVIAVDANNANPKKFSQRMVYCNLSLLSEVVPNDQLPMHYQ